MKSSRRLDHLSGFFFLMVIVSGHFLASENFKVAGYRRSPAHFDNLQWAIFYCGLINIAHAILKFKGAVYQNK